MKITKIQSINVIQAKIKLIAVKKVYNIKKTLILIILGFTYKKNLKKLFSLSINR